VSRRKMAEAVQHNHAVLERTDLTHWRSRSIGGLVCVRRPCWRHSLLASQTVCSREGISSAPDLLGLPPESDTLAVVQFREHPSGPIDSGEVLLELVKTECVAHARSGLR